MVIAQTISKNLVSCKGFMGTKCSRNVKDVISWKQYVSVKLQQVKPISRLRMPVVMCVITLTPNSKLLKHGQLKSFSIKSNRKAMSRNWGNQKANPALKTKREINTYYKSTKYNENKLLTERAAIFQKVATQQPKLN